MITINRVKSNANFAEYNQLSLTGVGIFARHFLVHLPFISLLATLWRANIFFGIILQHIASSKTFNTQLMHQSMYSTAPLPRGYPGMGRESAGEMTKIDSFCATGVRECAVAFTHVHDALGQGNTVPHHRAPTWVQIIYAMSQVTFYFFLMSPCPFL